MEPGSFYYPVRDAIWKTFGRSTLKTAMIYYFAEFFAIGYTSFLIVLIGYLNDEDAQLKHGIAYLMVFAAMMCGSVINKNKYIFDGYVQAIKLRKTIIASLYDKVAKLSMKALAETNSGKLVTIVSGDIQSVERALAMVPIVIAAPFVNITAYIVLGLTSGWQYALTTFMVWAVILVM